MFAPNTFVFDEKTIKTMKNLLVGALEGGSNYWYHNADYKFAPGITLADIRKGGKYTDPDDYFHPMQIIPFVPGCALLLEDAEDDNKVHELTLDKMKTGLKLMTQKYTHHWRNLITGNDDAETADVFLQLSLFQDIIYS